MISFEALPGTSRTIIILDVSERKYERSTITGTIAMNTASIKRIAVNARFFGTRSLFLTNQYTIKLNTMIGKPSNGFVIMVKKNHVSPIKKPTKGQLNHFP